MPLPAVISSVLVNAIILICPILQPGLTRPSAHVPKQRPSFVQTSSQVLLRSMTSTSRPPFSQDIIVTGQSVPCSFTLEHQFLISMLRTSTDRRRPQASRLMAGYIGSLHGVHRAPPFFLLWDLGLVWRWERFNAPEPTSSLPRALRTLVDLHKLFRT